MAATIRVGLRTFEMHINLDTKEYDLFTVTAGDYTVEMDISNT
jgi:hypothetical protein